MKHTMKQKNNGKHQNAFTLVELILGMTIMALVVVGAYSMLNTAMVAHTNGIQAMEINQAARIGLRQVADELRFALSGNAFWQPDTQIQILPPEQAFAAMTGPVVQERDPGKIEFVGQEDFVVFTRKVYQLNSNPPFDLQVCKIHVDPQTEQLLLTVVKSLLMIKRASWWYQVEFQTQLNGFTFASAGTTDVRYRPVGNNPEAPPLDVYIGDYGTINKSYLLAEHIKEIKFEYADSDSFRTDWDSKEIVREYKTSVQSPTFNALTDIIVREKGPPQVIKITMTMDNGETLMTTTDIPAGNMTNLGGNRNPQSNAGRQGGFSNNGQVPGKLSETQFNVPSVN